MNPRFKRLLSMLLVLVMIFSFLPPVTVSAASETAVTDQEIAIEVGESAKLKTTSRYQKTVWSSSDESIATVSSNGTVTGVAPGTATITAKTRSLFGFGKTKVTTYTVIVFEAEADEEEAITVTAGETLALSVDPDGGSVTWSSSDEEIAVVDENGVVTGVSAGDATITATIKKTTRTRWFFWWRTTITTEEVTFDITVLPAEEVIHYFTVTFESNGGSAVDEQVVEEGLAAAEPEAPVLDGCTFTGWYTDAELTTVYDFSTPVTADITLYAGWEEIINYFTVTFESNGGSAVDEQVIEEGLTAVEPEAPVLEGYTFTGWYADAELTTAYDFSTPVTADITLYAGWYEPTNVEPRTEYYVTFLRNDETGEPLLSVVVEPGSMLEKPEDPTREGYAFTGWYTDAHCIDAFDFTRPINCDTVLFAGWGNPSGEEGLYSHSSGGGTIYSITDIVVDAGQVGVTINTNSTAILYVEFLDETNGDLLAETAAQTPAYCEGEQILMPIDGELPEYFLVRATLYDLNGAELTTYTSIKYTTNYQIFENKTADDYEAEGENVVRFTNENITNFGVLADGVVELPSDGTSNIVTMTTSEDEENPDTLAWSTIYTIENPDETVLNAVPGTVLMLTNPDGTTYMFKVGTVTVQENGSAVIIPAEEVYMEDFYKALKVDMTIDIEGENEPDMQSAEPAQLYASPNGNARADINVDVNPTVKLGGPIEWTPKDHVKVSGELSGSGTADIKILYDVKLFADDYLECNVTTKLEITVDIQVVVTVEDDAKEKVHDKFKFLKVSVPTPIAGLTAFFKTSIPVDWELSAGLHFLYIYSNESGFIYDSYNGRQDVDKKSRTVTFGLEGKAELEFGPQIDLGIDLLGGVVEASVEVGAGLRVTATALIGTENTDGDSAHACALCIDGTIKWYVEVDVKLEVHICKALDWEIFDLNIVNITGNVNVLGLTPGQFYISLINSEDSIFGGHVKLGGGDCPNQKYRTEILTEDANGNETTGVTVTVEKQNGNTNKSGSTPYAVYLYNGVYNVSAKIGGKRVQKSVVVNSAPTTVTLTPSAADGKINGKVLNSETNEPVIGASVVISMGDMEFSNSMSDSAGGFTAHLPEGTYRVYIFKDGYVPYETYVTVGEGETEYLETSMMVEGDGQAMGGFSGQITNAVDDSPISGVKLQIRKGTNNTTQGDVIDTLYSDENGYFRYKTQNFLGFMIGLQAGNYTLYATKDGYASTMYNVVVEPGVVKENQDFTMSPTMESGEFRIVLRWVNAPSDLDSHYNAVTTDGYRDHVYYANRDGYSANLDRDDTDYDGPETITVTDFDLLDGGFTYSVHDYTNRSSTSSTVLSNSGAYVEVYRGETLLRTYYVPTGKVGTVWNVFSIDADGNLISLNTFDNVENPDSVGYAYTTNAVYTVTTLTGAPKKDYATK